MRIAALALLASLAVFACTNDGTYQRERAAGAQCVKERQKYGTSHFCLRGRVLVICNHHDECLHVALDSVSEAP